MGAIKEIFSPVKILVAVVLIAMLSTVGIALVGMLLVRVTFYETLPPSNALQILQTIALVSGTIIGFVGIIFIYFLSTLYTIGARYREIHSFELLGELNVTTRIFATIFFFVIAMFSLTIIATFTSMGSIPFEPEGKVTRDSFTLPIGLFSTGLFVFLYGLAYTLLRHLEMVSQRLL